MVVKFEIGFTWVRLQVAVGDYLAVVVVHI